ncbi:MptD family putative ECF transporter S component [Microbacterium sp. No. 7]|uniref:MptD family putative ECF transporter S component n=1 Tax=Microbacterium sp. No. 7 TaxID=1714373 RepID=UPI0006D2068E|nr:MptD family putative ECF transporter S component [Microbacterium sp. No. 7]ALJ19700.1 hypothetical protein AOA12_07195 [Microbacterium sp. No. 7]
MVRDLVTMGVFIALFMVLFFIGGMLSFFPIMMIVLPVYMGLFGAVIFTVLLGKVQRPGAFLIASILVGLILFRDAPGGITTICTIVGGLVAEILYGVLGRRTFSSMVISYSVFALGYALGTLIPFVWMREAYLELYADRDATVADIAREGTEMMNPVLLIVLCAATVIAAIAGCYWGRAMTRKQFTRAGVV